MKPCPGPIVLALAIIIITFFWWPAEWTKWVVMGIAALYIVFGLSMKQICLQHVSAKDFEKKND